jgi:hypothetical protein
LSRAPKKNEVFNAESRSPSLPETMPGRNPKAKRLLRVFDGVGSSGGGGGGSGYGVVAYGGVYGVGTTGG